MYSFSENVIGFFTPLRWSEDADRLAVTQEVSYSQNRVFLIRCLVALALMAVVFEFSPMVIGGVPFLLIAVKAISGVLAGGAVLAGIVSMRTEVS